MVGSCQPPYRTFTDKLSAMRGAHIKKDTPFFKAYLFVIYSKVYFLTAGFLSAD
jgi:hypothetical protein